MGLREIATGRPRILFKHQSSSPMALAWASDCRQVASAHANGTILLWEVIPTPTTAALPADKLQAAWTDLASDEAERAFAAIRLLAEHPASAVSFLRKRLVLVPVDPRKAAQWIAALDSDTFAVRQKATEELERLGSQVIGELKKALAGKPSLEVRARIDGLIEKIQTDRLEVVVWPRAVEALEHSGTAEAQQLLENLAAGPNGLRLTQEAQAAVARLAKQPRPGTK